MPFRPLPASPPRRRAVLLLLALGLLLQAQAGVLRQLLGAAHWHQPVSVQAQAAAGDSWLDRLQQWRQQVQARSPLIGGHGLAGHARRVAHDDNDGHHHAGLARHHHAPQAVGVVSVDQTGSDPLADSLAGSLLQPLALAAALGWPVAAGGGQAWARSTQGRWQDAGLRQPERPPQA